MDNTKGDLSMATSALEKLAFQAAVADRRFAGFIRPTDN
jgi:hypothetical protein